MIFGIGSVIRSGLGLVLVPVYSRHLTAAEFGVLSLLTVTLALVTIFLSFGLNHAFFRHYYETDDPAHRRRIVGSTLLFLLLSSLAITSLLYLTAPQISAALLSGDASKASLLRLVFLIGFFEVISIVPDSILRANFRSARYSTLNIIAFASQLALISYLVLVVDASVENVLIGRLAGTALEAVLFFVVVRRDVNLSFSSSEMREMLAFGAPLIFGQIAFNLFMMIDRFFLAHYSTKSEVGVYSMANSLVSIVTLLVTVPFSQVWTVMRFSVMKEPGAEEYYSRVLTYIVFVSMWLALGVAAVAGDGLLLFSLKGYWPAARIIPLLALSAVLDSGSRVLNIGITMKRRTIFAPIVIGAALIVNVGLNLLLIPGHGAVGATIATLLSYLVFCALRYWASNMFFKVQYEWGRVFTLVGLGAMLIALFYVSDFMRGSPGGAGSIWLALVIKIAIALSFPVLLLALRFYDERERRRIGEVWRKFSVEFIRRGLNESWILVLVSAGALVLLAFFMLFATTYGG